jgi:hypothetical protein
MISTSFRSISKFSTSKFSTACAIAIALAFSNVNLAHADEGLTESREASIEQFTDGFFYQANPELNRRKIQPGESGYIQEWQAIRDVVSQEITFNQNAGRRSCFPKWYVPNDDQAIFDRVTDQIFYTRNPDLNGQKINSTDRVNIRRW